MKDNPARRLKDILLQSSKFSTGNSFQRMWAKCFELDEQDTVEVNRRLLMLVDLFREVKQKMDRIDMSGTAIIWRPLDGFERKILPANLSVMEWEPLVTSDITNALEFCEDAIGKSTSHEEVNEHRRSELYSEVEDLVTEIQNSHVSPELKEHIGETLDDIKRAIVEYPIRGNEGLQQPIHILIGRVCIHRIELLEKAPGFCAMFWRFMGNAANILTLAGYADKLPVLMDAAKGLLGG